MHFLGPASAMRLMEVTCGKATAKNVQASVLMIAKRIGKIPVFHNAHSIFCRAADA
ncbi:hypothetical protein K1567_08530 [Pseudomonas sp. S5F11]|nr:hypothetical protein [Pseudomonas sp. S5F11]